MISLVRLGCVLWVTLAIALASSDARAQVIMDPELEGLSDSDSADSSGEQVIGDPELEGESSSSSDTVLGSSSAPSGSQGTGEARVVLHSRLGLDFYIADPREETVESTTVALLEGKVNRNESTRFVFGLLAQYRYASLNTDVPDALAERNQFDVAPTAGYVDLKLATGLHFQIGYQPVRLGRFDVMTATNVLAVEDLRDGPATLPEVGEIGQFALKIDYTPTGWLSFRAIYVPFFTPHIVSVSEGDYALFRQNQEMVNEGLGQLGLTDLFAANLSRADRELLAESTLSAFGPAPTLGKPQAALRITTNGLAGELGLTVATALEHLPFFYVSQELIDATLDPDSPEAAQALAMQPRPVSVAYDRFALFALDGAIDVAPLSLGFELAYMMDRTLYTIGEGEFPLNLPIPDRTDVVQLGLRGEFVEGSEWLIAVESYALLTLDEPSDAQREWLFLQGGRYSLGAGLFGYWAPDWGLRVELGLIGMTGPSLFFLPKLGYSLIDEIEIEVGAVIVQGEAPPVVATGDIAIGAMYDTVDQAYVGLRVIP